LVSGYSLPLGVYYDTESVAGGRANAISAAERTACAVAFGMQNHHQQHAEHAQQIYAVVSLLLHANVPFSTK
ncbi:hypothetical protein H6B10_17975, partial [Gemmiger formicilis]|uniref:hypothetical protein n=1 Tax=Gemmiger formicilis TaxID=745368 RepID=UPI0019596834